MRIFLVSLPLFAFSWSPSNAVASASESEVWCFRAIDTAIEETPPYLYPSNGAPQ
jgi:hypothetical protein